jgi:phosphohistidine phosphatase
MLVLVHHSDAVGPEMDPQRPLSVEGRQHAARLAAEAAARGVRPEVIWHSGKLRARQTADAFRSACNPSAQFSAIRGLQPTDPPEWMRDRLIGDGRQILITGHFPSLPRLLRLLVTGATDGGADEFPLHGLVALELGENGLWVMAWKIGD